MKKFDGLPPSDVDNDAVAVITGNARVRRVEIRRLLRFSINRVWDAIVEPEQIEQWFTAAEIDHHENGRLRLDFGSVVVNGTIKTFMPPHVLAYTWEQEGEGTSLVCFDLVETSQNETLLTVVQTMLDEDVAFDVGSGWHIMLERLALQMATSEPASLDRERENLIVQRYR